MTRNPDPITIAEVLADDILEAVAEGGPHDQLHAAVQALAEDSLKAAALAERERITALFSDWVEILMSEPNSHPPAAWKTAFAELIAIGD